MREIVLGGGCFWCIEAVMRRVKGVKEAISGYAGGKREDPTYQQVCSGATGHAEVVKVIYDENEITLDELLDIFFAIHDPTTLNRQGADAGTQYRSVVYYENEEEKKAIEAAIERAQREHSDPIVTEVSPKPKFYKAEPYHQNYYDQNPMQGYCQVVIRPKVQKFLTKFSDKIKQ
ncbi:Peptide methionine sulfoxide reductase MsrA [hydrothermal vent metagenome]|uniref:peptide-methionine (S)-S-oxide reductase n=1 Tax=hydrothermal vent metagenome TaxID=652676 RepID=A0A1W1BCD1_9ZZZZ